MYSSVHCGFARAAFTRFANRSEFFRKFNNHPLKAMSTHTDNASIDEGFDALGYCYASQGTFMQDLSVRGERNLWCAVIYQAFMDLEDKEEGAAAKRFLLHDKKDFLHVCSLAGISPLHVRMAALRLCESKALECV